MNIGENIKKYRKLNGITQIDLSKSIGKSVSTIQKYESNTVQPTLDVIEDIARVLKCEYTDIAISEEDWSRFTEMDKKEEMVKSINDITYVNEMYITPNYISRFEGDKTFDGVTIKYKNKTFKLTEKEYYKLADRIIESVTIDVLAAKEYK